jgi:hypothetical protein
MERPKGGGGMILRVHYGLELDFNPFADPDELDKHPNEPMISTINPGPWAWWTYVVLPQPDTGS